MQTLSRRDIYTNLKKEFVFGENRLKTATPLTRAREYDIILYVKKDTADVKKFFRRYWYWFVTIPVLIAVVFVWLYFLGIFEKSAPIVLNSSTPLTIDLYVDTSYRFSVTKENTDADIVFSSSMPDVVAVDETGMMTAHEEGTSIVTAKLGNHTKKVTVNVFCHEYKWFVTENETFSKKDIFNAFSYLGNSVTDTAFVNFDLLEVTDVDDGGEIYTVRTLGAKETRLNDDYDLTYVELSGNREKGNKIVSVRKAILYIYVFEDTEKRDAAKADYEKLVGKPQEIIPPAFDKAKIDVTKTFIVGEICSIIPSFSGSGLVLYSYECADELSEKATVSLSQTGTVTAYEKAHLYVTAFIADADYVCRYDLSFEPSTTAVEIRLNEEPIYLNDYEGFFPENTAEIVPSSERLQPILDGDEGTVIGYKGVTTTRENEPVYLYAKDQKGAVIAQIAVTIKKLPGGGE